MLQSPLSAQVMALRAALGRADPEHRGHGTVDGRQRRQNRRQVEEADVRAYDGVQKDEGEGRRFQQQATLRPGFPMMHGVISSPLSGILRDKRARDQ
ncbi:hypothetical protein [Streptomyces sp. NPDC006785]|uniref:hypothetical protein n=1 Tax=Streptomyces sp. NPDC006785 TaxID=3155461 RepID=UPI0033E8DD7D